LILIAPVNTREKSLVKNYKHLKAPIHVIYGSVDDIVSLQEMTILTNILATSQLKIYQNAGHAPYLDDPETFKKNLLNYYNDITANKDSGYKQ
jgi:pimeloyl-ACP methyl ester carboxylesterase